MTIFEYARCIDEAAGLDLDLDCKEIDLQDKFYGLFQCFMPDGVGVETVFAPLQNGTELQARIMPIYSVTAQRTQEAFGRGVAPVAADPRDSRRKRKHEISARLNLEFENLAKLYECYFEFKSRGGEVGFYALCKRGGAKFRARKVFLL